MPNEAPPVVLCTPPAVKAKGPKNPQVLTQGKANNIMTSCQGAERTDTPWSPATKAEWIEKFQAEGVGADGKPAKLHIFLPGMDTVDLDTGKTIKNPRA